MWKHENEAEELWLFWIILMLCINSIGSLSQLNDQSSWLPEFLCVLVGIKIFDFYYDL